MMSPDYRDDGMGWCPATRKCEHYLSGNCGLTGRPQGNALCPPWVEKRLKELALEQREREQHRELRESIASAANLPPALVPPDVKESLVLIDRMGADGARLRRAERSAQPDVGLCERVVHTLLPDVESIRLRLEKLRSESWAEGFLRARASLEISFCVHCGRVYVVDQKDTTREACDCGQELYPVSRRLMLESELKAGDDHSLRIVGAAACKENATMETKRSSPGQLFLISGTTTALRAAARWSALWRRGKAIICVEKSDGEPCAFIKALRDQAEADYATVLIIDDGSRGWGNENVTERLVDATIRVDPCFRQSGVVGYWRAQVTQDRNGYLPLAIDFGMKVLDDCDKTLIDEWRGS